MNSQFLPMESIYSATLTFLVKGFGYLMAVTTSIIIIVMLAIVVPSNRIPFELKFPIASFFIIVMVFIIYGAYRQSIADKNNTCNRIIVDCYGLHRMENEKTLSSLTYDSLRSNPDHNKEDIHFWEGEDIDIVVYYWDNEENITKSTYISFNLTLTLEITNANKLKKHFFEGVLQFRPDLKVSPSVIDFFNIEAKNNQ